MSSPHRRLSQVHIATPCGESWERMPGSAQVRFCGRCEKHVYNLSAMTEVQAGELLAEQSGARCVRFLQRADGSIVTAPAAPASLPGLAAAAALAALAGSACQAEPSTSLDFGAVAAPSTASMGEPVPAPPALSEAELEERLLQAMGAMPDPGFASPAPLPVSNAELSRVVQEHRADIHKCCDREPVNDPIDVFVVIEVKKSGRVQAVTYQGTPSTLGQCIAQRAKRWRFAAASKAVSFAVPVECDPKRDGMRR